MRATALLCCTAVLLGCGGGEETPATDTSTAVAPAPAPAPTLSLAELAGTWNQTSRAETGDSVLVTAVVTATADTAGWTMTFPGRKPVPMRVRVDGDSILASAGPYESAIRKGVQVNVESVFRRQADGKLAGLSIARYQSAGADSVLRLRTELTRAP